MIITCGRCHRKFKTIKEMIKHIKEHKKNEIKNKL